MKISVLGSGSAGNSLVLDSLDGGYWIVDVGLSAKQMRLRLAQLGIALEEVRGIFISHEHRDHIAGLPVFMKQCSAQVYVSHLTCEYLTSQLGYEADWKIFEPGQSFQAGPLQVEPVSIPHDATDPVGFIVTQRGRKVGIMTDLGYVSESLRRRLGGVEMLYVESNYDLALLENDQKRPWSIKQRISSRHGHLSNEQALDLIRALQAEGLQKVIFGHLSRDCNTPQTIEALLAAEESMQGMECHISRQEGPTPWLTLAVQHELTPVRQYQQLGLF